MKRVLVFSLGAVLVIALISSAYFFSSVFGSKGDNHGFDEGSGIFDFFNRADRSSGSQSKGNDFDEVGFGSPAKGSSQGGGGAGGGSGNFLGNCEMRGVSYSAVDFIAEEFCNQYSGGDCIDKMVSCSVKITNLDSEIGGVFELIFRFSKEEGGEFLYSEVLESNVRPRRSHIFESIFNVLGENANEDINCFYNTVSIPEKEICY